MFNLDIEYSKFEPMIPTFELKIVTPYGVSYDGVVEKVTLPTTTGQLTILANHSPLISSLSAGQITVTKEGAEHHFAVSSGVLEMRPGNQLVLVADTVERAEEIDLDRATRAHARAEELLKQKDMLEDVEFARVQAKIEKELARLSVAKKYRS